jgi:sarcosine oxidase
MKYDAIVIGLGAMGSAAVYQLAKRGAKVLGIDRFTPPHTYGSSHGETRITRLACGEGPEYSQFAQRSHAIWRDLEHDTGVSLLVQNGFLAISGEGKRAANHENLAFLDTSFEAARQAGIAHEALDDRAIMARFPAFNFAAGDRAYFEPEGGFVYPERCVDTQLRQAGKLGAELRAGETVTGFAQSSDGVEVTTDRATYSAGQVIVSAGAWLPGLLRREQAQEFVVRRQVMHWFRVREGEPLDRYRADRFPTYIWQLPARQAIYGFPWTGDGTPTIKVATEQYDTATTADAVDRTVSAQEIDAMYREFVAPYFPGATGVSERAAVCLYICVPHARFVIDRLPDNERVIVASPCSGHGFKHSAAIGQALAELATEGRSTSFDLSKFKFAK